MRRLLSSAFNVRLLADIHRNGRNISPELFLFYVQSWWTLYERDFIQTDFKQMSVFSMDGRRILVKKI
jgi:hypothetical protein